MDNKLLWLLTSLVIVFVVLCVIVALWIIYLKICKLTNRHGEKEILLSDDLQQCQSMYDSWIGADKADGSSGEDRSLPVDRLPGVYCPRNDSREELEENLNNFVKLSYEIIFTLRLLEEGYWNLQIEKVMVLNDLSDDENTKQMYLVITVPNKENEKPHIFKSEQMKFERDMTFAEDFHLSVADDKVKRVDIQLVSMDKYARKKVKSEVTMYIGRVIADGDRSSQTNVRMFMLNIAEEEQLASLNEDFPNSALLLFAVVYSIQARTLFVYLDTITSNLQANSRRNTELSVDVVLVVGTSRLTLSCQNTTPETDSGLVNDTDPMCWIIDYEDLMTASLEFHTTILRPLSSFSGFTSVSFEPEIFHVSSNEDNDANRCVYLYSKCCTFTELEESTISRNIIE